MKREYSFENGTAILPHRLKPPVNGLATTLRHVISIQADYQGCSMRLTVGEDE